MYTKKLFQLVALLIVVSSMVFAQTSWTGGAGNRDWFNTNNWTAGVPDASTDAIVLTATYQPVIGQAGAVCKTLTVTSGTLDLGGTGASTNPGTLTVSGQVYIDAAGTIAGDQGTLNLTGNWVRVAGSTFFTGTGSTIVLNGTTAQSIDATSFYNLTINKASGTASLTGNITVGNVLTLTAGTFNASSFTVNLTGTGATPLSIGAGIFTAGTSTVSYKNTVNTNVAAASYYNLDINRAGYQFTPTAALTVSGVLSINGGELITGNFTHNIKGSLTIASGGSAIFTASAPGTLNFNGVSAQQIPTGLTYQDLKINNAAGVTLFGTSGGATISSITIGDVTANSTFSDGGFQIFLPTGSTTAFLNLSSTATLKIGSATAATILPVFPTALTLAAGSTIEYAAAVNQSVAASANYQNLTLSGGAVKTLAGANTAVAGTLLINLGVTATVPNSVVVTSNGTLTNNGTITLTGTGCLTVAGVTGTQAIGVLNGSGNLGFAAGGAQTVNLGTITSTGVVAFSNTAANVITFVGSSSVASNFKNLQVTSSAFLTPINDWTTAASGSVTMAANSALSIGTGRTLTIGGTFVATAPSTIWNSGTVTQTQNVTGASTYDSHVGAGAFNYNSTAATATLNVTGNFTSTGTVTLGGTGTIAFGGAPGSLKNLIWNNTGSSSVIGNWTVTNNITIGSGATVPVNGNQVTVGGSITESDATAKLTMTGTIIFNGTSAQTWTLGATRDYNSIAVTLNKAGGNLYVKGGSVKTAALTFTTATPINMGANTLTLMGVTPGYSGAAGYIYNGSVAATVAAATLYTFPVGDGSAMTSLALTAPSTVPGLTTVGFVNADPGGTTPNLLFNSSGPSSIVVSRASAYYWTVNTQNSLATQTDLVITLGKAVSDPFQTYDVVRAVVRGLDTDPWTRITGTYANTGAGNNITTVALTAGAGAITGSVKVAYGLASAIVSVGGLVYYGDLAMTTGNEVGNVTVSLTSTNPAVNLTQLIASGASTLGYNFTNVGGLTTAGYTGTVTGFPAWTGVTGTSSTDAVAIRNTIVGRTVGAITASETMKIIAADVDNSGGAVVFGVTPPLTSITSVDVMQVLQRAAGTITSFARGDFYSTSYTTSTTLLANLTNQNLRVIGIGDASYSAVPTQLKRQQVLFATEGNINVDSKNAFMVPVKMAGDKVEAAAFTMAFKYPSDQVKFAGIVSSLKGLTAVDMDGYIRMMMIDMTGDKPAVLAGELANLKFVPKAGFNANRGFALELDEKHTSFANTDAQAISMSLSAPRVGAALPTEFELSQNYPNPFNPSTSLNYAVPEMGRVSVKIYNVLGQEVASLFDGVQEPGRYTTQWNAGGFASGMYIVRMTGSSATKNFSSIVKIMLLK